ncbi:MAG: preprotein translocase subunit SecG [Candidatus Omnitrophota bacterium]
MYILIILVHVLACVVLIAVILLQAGRGGGLTEVFSGGETAQSLLGTQAPVLLKKATTVSAVVFLCTSLLLGVLSAKMGRSLFDQSQLPLLPRQLDTAAGTPLDAEAVMPQGPAPAEAPGAAPQDNAPAAEPAAE